jgi:hypothetical protein
VHAARDSSQGVLIVRSCDRSQSQCVPRQVALDLDDGACKTQQIEIPFPAMSDEDEDECAGKTSLPRIPSAVPAWTLRLDTF